MKKASAALYRAALYRAALRQQVRAALPDDFKVADYSARAIRRQLAASEFTERHLRFTDNFLDRLEAEVLPEAPSLRKQAWWLDVSAELVNVWTATFERRRDELAAMVREARQPSTSTRKARGPSVGSSSSGRPGQKTHRNRVLSRAAVYSRHAIRGDQPWSS